MFRQILLSKTIDAQFETGATHDMRIFTGSALLAVPRQGRARTHAGQREFQKAHIFLPGFLPGLRSSGKLLFAEDRKIVGRPTVFGKPAGAANAPPSGTLRRCWARVLPDARSAPGGGSALMALTST